MIAYLHMLKIQLKFKTVQTHKKTVQMCHLKCHSDCLSIKCKIFECYTISIHILTSLP